MYMFNNGRFYYQSLESDGNFYTSRPFRAVYTSSATTVHWQMPTGCTITSSTGSGGSTILIACTSAGLYTFQVYPDSQSSSPDTFLVQVAANAPCYSWYMATSGSLSSAAPTVHQASSALNYVPAQSNFVYGLIWVVDPRFMSAAEVQGTAIAPSSASKQLTTALNNMGEIPGLTPGGLLLSQFVLNNVTFDPAQSNLTYAYSAWVFSFNTSASGATQASIQGVHVTVLNCMTGDRPQILSVSNLDMASAVYPVFTALPSSFSTVSGSSTLSGGSFLRMSSDACSANTQIAVSPFFGSSNAIFSDDAFQQYILPLGLQSSVAGAGVLIKTIAIIPTTQTLVILSTAGSVYLAAQGSTLKSSVLTGMTNIRTASSCDVISPIITYAAAWNKANNVNTFYLYTSLMSRQRPSTLQDAWTPIQITSAAAGVSIAYIHDIAFQQSSINVIVLVRRTDGSDQSLIYRPAVGPIGSVGLNFASGWTPGAIITSNSAYVPPLDTGVRNAILQIAISRPNTGEALLYGDNLLYTPNDGITVFPIALESRDSARPAVGLGSTETIAQVATSLDKQFLVLTSLNRYPIDYYYYRVFYGRLGVTSAVEITAGLSLDQPATLDFDALNRGVVRTLTANSPYVSTRILPIANDIAVTGTIKDSPSLKPCPFSQYQDTFPDEVFMDLDGNLTFSSQLITPSGSSPGVAFQFNNPSILTSSINFSQQLVPNFGGAALYTKTLNTAAASYLTPGTTGVNINVAGQTLQCPTPPALSVIRAYCPPTRTLVVHRTPTDQFQNCSSTDIPSSTTIASGMWTNWLSKTTGTTSKTVPFDCSRFGPPLYAYYNYVFQPLFDIYDNGNLAHNVTGDMVVFEINGRNSYTFNSTAQDVGCIQAPQTWSSMMAANPSVFPYYAWNTSMYQPCYTPPLTGKAAPLTQPTQVYEILNGTNNNRLVWQSGAEGLYMFKAKVIDPSYSFCTLEVEFAVLVYGAPLPVGVQVGIIFGIIFGILLMLAASYWWYRKQKTKEKEL
ncbi:hypothetical protein RI367_007529 [Sorochytrium milnesiophthora]